MDKHFCPYCMSPVPEGEICPVCGLTAGNYVPSPHHLPPGTILMDRYLVGRVLGEGGFGITYIGCDLRLEMKVAIKEYYPVDRATRNASVSAEVTSFMGAAAKSYERGKQKFLEEARIMAKMDKQQAIVSVRDFFESNNTVYIVMEYVEGITLKDLVEKKGGRIAPEELFPMLEPLFKALSMFHETGLIHRDISPDNLMLEDGKIRLLDFGCAREAGGGKETLTIALKHGYAPLEQYRQKGQGPWTDIYALCATIYYCLVGKAPPQALDRIGEDPLLLPTKLGVHLTEQEERALLKGLRIQPRRRFQTVAELHAALYEDAPVEDEEPEEPDLKIPAPEPNVSGFTVSVSEEEAQPPLPGEDEIPEPGEEPEERPERRKGVFSRTGYLVGLGFLALMFITLLVSVVFRYRDEEAGVSQPDSNLSEELAGIFQGDGVFVFHHYDGYQQIHDPLEEDDSVTAVVIPEGWHADYEINELLVTKPILIEQGGSLRCDTVILTGNGQIQVEGEFECSYLRLADDTVFHAYDSAGVSLDNAIIWADRDEQLQLDDPQYDAQIRKSTFFVTLDSQGRDAISVTSAEELGQYLNEKNHLDKMLSVDADINLTGDYDLAQPLRISEGASLRISGNMNMGEEAALLNCGTLMAGNLYTDQGTPLVNLGRIGTAEDPLQFWLDGGSAVVNEGMAWFDNVSRLWMGRVVNLPDGTVCADDMILANSTMDNFGEIQALSGREGFMISQGGRLRNFGTLTVQPGSQLRNYGFIENYGQMFWGKDSRILNCYLQNQGVLTRIGECQIDQLGAVYGSGEFLNMYDLPYRSVRGDTDWSQAVSVSTEQAFVNELADGAGDILVDGDLTVTLTNNFELREGRTIFVGGHLVLEGPGNLNVTGGRIYLLGGIGRLDMLTDITLRDNSDMRLDSGSALGGVGTLTLDSSTLWGWNFSLDTGGATVRLQNHSVFAPGDISSIQGGSAFSLAGGSVFVIPWMGDINVYRTSFTVEDPESSLINLGVCYMDECSLDIQGRFLNCGWETQLGNCQMNIGQEGSGDGILELVNTNMRIHGDSTVTNWGSVYLDAWDEFSVTFAYNDPEGLVNYGDIRVETRSFFENNAGIRNEGYIGISVRRGFETSRITGGGQVEFY